MEKNDIIERVPFAILFRELVSYCERQYGEVKVKDIFEKVQSSIKINSFLRDTFDRRVRPGTNDYLLVVIRVYHLLSLKLRSYLLRPQ